MLTREDIGYGPARQYEAAGGLDGPQRHNRRSTNRTDLPFDDELGPYQQRLRRRQRPDRWIEAELEETLFLDSWIDADRIDIEVVDGVATLIGTLTDVDEIARALWKASRVPGIRSLRNCLELGG